MNSVCFCSLPVWRSFFEEGEPNPPSRDLFCHALDPPLGRYGQIILMHVPGHEHFIPTKFHKHPLSGSVVKADSVFPYKYMHKCTPSPFHLNKYIENSLKFLKHLNLLLSILPLTNMEITQNKYRLNPLLHKNLQKLH